MKKQQQEDWMPEFLRIKARMEDEQRFWAAVHALGFTSRIGVSPGTDGFDHHIAHPLIATFGSNFSIREGRVIMIWFNFQKQTFVNWSAEGYSYAEFLSKLKKIISGYIKELEGFLLA